MTLTRPDVIFATLGVSGSRITASKNLVLHQSYSIWLLNMNVFYIALFHPSDDVLPFHSIDVYSFWFLTAEREKLPCPCTVWSASVCCT